MSSRFFRASWLAFAGVALVSIALGFTGAKILANENISYLASYTWLGLMIIGVPLVLGLFLTGTILNMYPSTRRSGMLAIMAAVLIVASSFTSFKILDAFGKVQYRHEQMVSIGPEVQASLVIYFKHGTTNDQINYFWQNVLSYPDPQGRGYYHRDGVSMLSAVYPAVDGHEGVAVNFFANATEAQRRQLRRDVDASPVVFKVLENVAPADVKTLTRR